MTASNWANFLASGILAAGFATQAKAAPLVDDYWGGNDGPYNSDVVAASGDTRFNINSVTVVRTGNDLNVTIATNYSGSNVGAAGTNLGALFFGEISKLNYNGGGVAPTYNNDRFGADPDRFSYAFDFNAVGSDVDGVDNTGTIPATQSGSATLYSLLGTGVDVVKSNIGGDTTATNIRRDQAVDIVGAYKTASNTILTGTWSTTAGSVTFNLVNFFSTLPSIYSSSFTLAWAMTCANDIIVKRVAFSGDTGREVPLPAGALLLFSGLTGLGLVGRLRKKRASVDS